MYYIIHPDEISHYGVKGMKWGIRHDKPRSGRKKSMSRWDKAVSKDYQRDYKISKKEADRLAQERNRKIKRLIIGAGVATGAAVVTIAAIKYGRMYGDDILKAGTKIQTVHHDTKIIDTGKFYTTNKGLDKIKYIGEFGKNADGLKKKITADVTSDIKSLGVKNGEKLYQELINTSPDFKKAVTEATVKLDRKTGMFVKALGDKQVNYKDFNTLGLLGAGNNLDVGNVKEAQRIFLDAAKKKGYGAIADVNDRINSGFGTKANIVFNTAPIANIKISNITEKEYIKNKVKANAIIIAQMKANPANATLGGLAVTGLGMAYVDQSMNNKLNKQYKRNKPKKVRNGSEVNGYYEYSYRDN